MFLSHFEYYLPIRHLVSNPNNTVPSKTFEETSISLPSAQRYHLARTRMRTKLISKSQKPGGVGPDGRRRDAGSFPGDRYSISSFVATLNPLFAHGFAEARRFFIEQRGRPGHSSRSRRRDVSPETIKPRGRVRLVRPLSLGLVSGDAAATNDLNIILNNATPLGPGVRSMRPTLLLLDYYYYCAEA